MKRSHVLTALLTAVLVAMALAGCAPSTAPDTGGSAVAPAPIRIGTLPTEDSLPLWAAESDGAFTAAGLKVEIVSFASAQERDAALTAGAIDGFMGDIIAASALNAGGVPVRVTTIMLGATPAEGRFGIAVKPGSKVTDAAGLAGAKIGTSSGTIQEYVLDGLMTAASVSTDQFSKEEVKKVPVRFELLMAGKLDAAALPEPFLSLAESQGTKVVADDTQGKNLSQTVLVFSQKYLDDPAGALAVQELLGVWDQEVAKINASPEDYRALLIEKAKLPEPLKTTYKINTYPTHQLPTEEQVGDVLSWMHGNGLLTKEIAYGDIVWAAGDAK